METDAKKRKALPLCTGVLDYFPDALLAVAELSRIGNDQHNPGKPLHWDRSKSGDESDALLRHLVQRGTLDTDGVRHSTKVAWRALANLQKELEEAGLPMSRGSVAVTNDRPEIRIPPPTSESEKDLPHGYCYLDPGSIIQEGDWFWSPSFEEWVSSSEVGKSVGTDMTNFVYIRRF